MCSSSFPSGNRSVLAMNELVNEWLEKEMDINTYKLQPILRAMSG